MLHIEQHVQVIQPCGRLALRKGHADLVHVPALDPERMAGMLADMGDPLEHLVLRLGDLDARCGAFRHRADSGHRGDYLGLALTLGLDDRGLGLGRLLGFHLGDLGASGEGSGGERDEFVGLSVHGTTYGYGRGLRPEAGWW